MKRVVWSKSANLGLGLGFFSMIEFEILRNGFRMDYIFQICFLMFTSIFIAWHIEALVLGGTPEYSDEHKQRGRYAPPKGSRGFQQMEIVQVQTNPNSKFQQIVQNI